MSIKVVVWSAAVAFGLCPSFSASAAAGSGCPSGIPTREYKNESTWCQPQCVDYVNFKLGLSHHVGTAANWWNNPPRNYRKRDNGGKYRPRVNGIIVWTQYAGGTV